MYEKCMYSRLYAFLTKLKLLIKKRFGFRNNHSTSHSLISIHWYLDNIILFVEFFISLQKVFGTVNHEILLVKLDFYGIRGLANRRLKSFLENRKQYVNLLGHSSSGKTVTCVVLQSSTLGTLLFLIYINDLQSAFSK